MATTTGADTFPHRRVFIPRQEALELARRMFKHVGVPEDFLGDLLHQELARRALQAPRRPGLGIVRI